jgi:hypothetical protein
MATRPVNCTAVQNLEGFRFDRTNLVLDQGTRLNPEKIIGLDDINLEVKSFSKFTVNIRPGGFAMISQGDIADDSGYVTFLALKAIYPPNILEKDKYIFWTYRDETLNMGELLILSGPNLTTVDSEEMGWNLVKPGPVYQDGGIILHNPHSTIRVKIEVLVCR